MNVILSIYLGIVGAAFGSFIGAMVWRVKTKRPVALERSQCESCKHTLHAIDLIPIVSWVLLRGRCRYCKARIGTQTVLIEVGMALAFVLSFLLWPYPLIGVVGWLLLVLWLVIVVMLGFLFVYDARYFLLPDIVVKPLILASLVLFLGIRLQFSQHIDDIAVEALLSLLPITGLYGLLYAVSSGKWVGFGDVKLGVALGLIVGWPGALLVLFLANVIGTVYVLPGLLTGTLNRAKHIPFGPFLIVATLVVFLGGDIVIDWYKSLLYL